MCVCVCVSHLRTSDRAGVSGDGPTPLRQHSLRHGVAAGVLAAHGECSGALDGERGRGACAGCGRVSGESARDGTDGYGAHGAGDDSLPSLRFSPQTRCPVQDHGESGGEE